jgi:hypothetical protein
MSTLRLALLAFALALATAAAIGGRSESRASEPSPGLVSLAAIDEFLADSRRYLGL